MFFPSVAFHKCGDVFEDAALAPLGGEGGAQAPGEGVPKYVSELMKYRTKEAGALASHRIGNVAYRVVTEAECPVLTVRAHSGNKTHSGPGKTEPERV